MLRIILPPREAFDDEKEEFVLDPPTPVTFEHSLLSLSQWESKYKKPLLTLLTNGGLKSDELLDYFGMMIVGPPNLQNIQNVLARLSPENLNDLLKYLDDSQTATVIVDREPPRPSRRSVTAELIYCWMIGLNIDKVFETWNLNRLMTLIRVVSIETNPDKKKMRKSEVASMQRDLNELNKARLGTKG